jgi:hypothetical protein
MALQEYLENPDYQYAEKTPEGSLLNRWWQAFTDMLRQMFSDGRNSWHNVLSLIIISVGLVLLIYYLSKSRFGSVFKGRDERGALTSILDTDIPATSLDILVAQAVKDGDYRLAYRWAYLDLLRKLHDAGSLRLHREKTNRDYKREMRKHAQANRFAPLADTFDRIWYGGYPMDAETFHNHRSVMPQLFNETPTS